MRQVEARTEQAVAASNRAIDVGETLLLAAQRDQHPRRLRHRLVLCAGGRSPPRWCKITDAAAAFEEARYEPESLAERPEPHRRARRSRPHLHPHGGEVQARTDTLDRLVAERTRELNNKNALLEDANQRMDAELAIARTLQTAMLPRLPESPRYTGKATMVPAREMGGDFYDFFSVGDNRVGLVIADVSGKGVPAAFFMAISRTILQGSARERRTAGTCLADTNDLLCQQNPLDLFVTAFYGILDLDTGELSYANAGHNPPLLAREDGTVSHLPGTGGIAMGVMPGVAYAEGRATLSAGDTLLLYTDGISEAMDREGRRVHRGAADRLAVREPPPVGRDRHVVADRRGEPLRRRRAAIRRHHLPDRALQGAAACRLSRSGGVTPLSG